MTVKRMPKVLAAVSAAFALLFVPANVSAYDGTVWGGYHGNFTRADFIQAAGNSSAIQNNFISSMRESSGRNNIFLERFFFIGADDVDEEDMQVLGELEMYIADDFRVSHGDFFEYAVLREQSNTSMSGWLVMSHYHSTQGWLHYMYFFVVNL